VIQQQKHILTTGNNTSFTNKKAKQKKRDRKVEQTILKKMRLKKPQKRMLHRVNTDYHCLL